MSSNRFDSRHQRFPLCFFRLSAGWQNKLPIVAGSRSESLRPGAGGRARFPGSSSRDNRPTRGKSGSNRSTPRRSATPPRPDRRHLINVNARYTAATGVFARRSPRAPSCSIACGAMNRSRNLRSKRNQEIADFVGIHKSIRQPLTAEIPGVRRQVFEQQLDAIVLQLLHRPAQVGIQRRLCSWMGWSRLIAPGWMTTFGVPTKNGAISRVRSMVFCSKLRDATRWRSSRQHKSTSVRSQNSGAWTTSLSGVSELAL